MVSMNFIFISSGYFGLPHSGAEVGDVVVIETTKRAYSEDGMSYWPETDEKYFAEIVVEGCRKHTVRRLDNGECCDVMDYDIVRKATPLEALAQTSE